MKALDYLYAMKKAYDEALGTEPIVIYEAIKELEALTTSTTQQTKTVTSTRTDLIYCPLKNSSCILSKCAAYTTHKEPDILKCDECGDTFRRGERCKNYVKGKSDHIKMSLYKNMAYCKHFKCHVYS